MWDVPAAFPINTDEIHAKSFAACIIFCLSWIILLFSKFQGNEQFAAEIEIAFLCRRLYWKCSEFFVYQVRYYVLKSSFSLGRCRFFFSALIFLFGSQVIKISRIYKTQKFGFTSCFLILMYSSRYKLCLSSTSSYLLKFHNSFTKYQIKTKDIYHDKKNVLSYNFKFNSAE